MKNQINNNILLPKGYLSATAMTQWIKDKNEFIRLYFEKAPRFQTKYTEFGKYIHDLIEKDQHKHILPDIVKYEHAEHEIITVVNGVPVLLRIDTYSKELALFRDYKTANKPWTKKQVQKNEQMLFYATALKWHTGIICKGCYIDWIETKERPKSINSIGLVDKGGLYVTGKVVPFYREFDEREIERMERLILEVALEISNAYKQFIESL